MSNTFSGLSSSQHDGTGQDTPRHARAGNPVLSRDRLIDGTICLADQELLAGSAADRGERAGELQPERDRHAGFQRCR